MDVPFPDPDRWSVVLAERFHAAVASGDSGEARAIQAFLNRGDPRLADATDADLGLLAWQRDYPPAEHRNFIFVSGAPRSGTTALGRLLRLHPEVAIFTELFKWGSGYLPQMFAAANIDRLHREGRLVRLEKFMNPEMRERATPERLIGDKRPNFMNTAAISLSHFAGRAVTIVHIVRPIRQVALSYAARAATGSWSAGRNHVAAVKEAGRNNRTALALAEGLAPEHRLLVVDYERLWAGHAPVERLFGAIGLDAALLPAAELAKMLGASAAIIGRKQTVPDAVAAYIAANYDEAAEATLRARSVV